MRLSLWLAGCLWAQQALGGDYHLAPVPVAEGVWVLAGQQQSFSRDNGGNIANTGFIIDADGISVIDTGPSREYGLQQRAAIARISRLPVRQVYLTHAHPDHFLGSQAYPPAVLLSLAATADAIGSSGDALLDNMFRLVGGWMRDTQVVIPQHILAATTNRAQGRVSWIPGAGHTAGDLLVLDEKTRTLFTGDLVFWGRAPTTPNADIDVWLASLERIDQLAFETLVPGHGPVARDHAPIAQTRDYLRWLTSSLQDAAHRGLDMVEVMQLPVPARFERLAEVRNEYQRSVSHLYPAIEQATLKPVTPR